MLLKVQELRWGPLFDPGDMKACPPNPDPLVRDTDPDPDFLCPNGTRFARGHFRAQISLDFQGPPLPMALEMDVAHIKIISPSTL